MMHRNTIQNDNKNLFRFEKIMKKISKLPGEKQEKVSIYVQGMLAGMDKGKPN